MKTVKIFFIGLASIIAVFFLWWYINGNLFKSKAAVDKVNITYSSANLTVTKNENFNLGVILNAENAKKISAVDLNFKYDSDNLDLIDYVGVQTIPENYFNDKIIETSSTVESAKNLHLVLVAKKPDGSLSSAVTLNLTFKAKNQDAQTTIGLTGTNQVVGTTEDRVFDLTIPTNPAIVVVGSGDNNPTLTPTITQASGSANLFFRVRFQGIIDPPKKQTTLPVKILIKKQADLIDERTINFQYDKAATGSAKGRWLGSGNFNIAAGSDYTIFIKGPKHVQKKICDPAPIEASGAEGTYHCSIGKIQINNGDQTFDFSKILLLAGDLPQQDGVVNSYDTSLVRNNLGKTDSDSLLKSDINLDGRINTQDYSLIIYALSIRTDEE